ncbi:hypothetical protein LUZ60_016189 [Juncus effusus]|nr:hypothetical protein LUZ60_016189 [Juncus effusus]
MEQHIHTPSFLHSMSSEQESYTSNANPNPNSSSSSRSSLSSNTSIIFPQTPRRSMEDVWKDISLMTPLQNHHHHQNFQKHHPKPNHFHDTNPNSFKGMILQDFLAGPLNRPVETTLPQIPPQNTPRTVLSLNSLEFNYLRNGPSSNNSSSGDSARVNGRLTDQTSSYMSSAFPEMIVGPSSPGNILSFCSKTGVLPEARTGTGDRRQKRMIKNRESAARSRARKQAYTNELELEVAHLMDENSKLKKQQDELRVAMAAQVPTRSSLHRCSSSPF